MLASAAMREALAKIREQVESAPPPKNLMERVRDRLQPQPEISWDRAVADIVREDYGQKC